MKSNMENFVKGVGMGMVMGCTVGVVGASMMHKRHKGLKHNASKAIHSFGDMLENVTGMF